MKLSDKASLKNFLDKKVDEYNQRSFINADPICIPHSFSKKQDIEISGFFAAIFAWGNRTTIINKSRELMQLMDNAPHEFILNHKESDLKKLLGFKHRTFNTTDLLYFVEFLKHHYSKNKSLESAFFNTQTLQIEASEASPTGGGLPAGQAGLVRAALNYFYDYFFSLEDAPTRTAKHIASPQKKSTCKRLNMFLRWMVRNDNRGVDFGIWKSISPAELICPVDVHVARVARHFNLLNRKATDWEAALELTNNLRKLDKTDPVKYDFALFGLGVMENSQRVYG
jgi:uncharacterized protein (TIGR02757 family)